jgi:pimeloyl-ACP methyl ester carboxylesterase
VIPAVVAAVRTAECRPVMPYYLIGHSAGGQFLVRLAAFAPGEAVRIVAANAGSHLAPTREQPYGYGFGRLPDEAASDATLRRYLAAPLTFYQGTGDTATTREQDQHLDTSAEAKKQGACRLERGRNTFRQAKELAERRGWEFRWRLVEADGVGHVAAEMFKHPKCADALFGPKDNGP